MFKKRRQININKQKKICIKNSIDLLSHFGTLDLQHAILINIYINLFIYFFLINTKINGLIIILNGIYVWKLTEIIIISSLARGIEKKTKSDDL